MMNRLPAWVINLPQERERRTSVASELARIDVDPHFIEAYDGHDPHFPFSRYKDLWSPFWGRPHDFKPGAFACYLSHARCWRRIEAGPDPWGLVVEDDALVYPRAFHQLSANRLPPAFDVIYLNKRMYNWARHPSTGIWRRLVRKLHARLLPAGKRFEGVSSLLKRLVLDGTFKSDIPAPGSDGYLVSQKGASKLLGMMHSRKICMGVDYAMVFNTLSKLDIASFMDRQVDSLPSSLRFFLTNEKRWVRSGDHVELESYVYTAHAGVETKRFASTLRHEVFLTHAVFDDSQMAN